MWTGGRSSKGGNRGRIGGRIEIQGREKGAKKEKERNRLTFRFGGVAMSKYLCIVANIEAQADQAGLELLCAQSARVVLGRGGPVPGEVSGAQAMQQHTQRSQ